MDCVLSCGNRLAAPDVRVHGDTMGKNNTLSGDVRIRVNESIFRNKAP